MAFIPCSITQNMTSNTHVDLSVGSSEKVTTRLVLLPSGPNLQRLNKGRPMLALSGPDKTENMTGLAGNVM